MNLLPPADGLVVLLPLLGAITLGLVANHRIAARINILFALATFAAAVHLAYDPPPPGSFLLADRLSVHLALLTSFIGASTSFVSLGFIEAEMTAGLLDRRRARLYHAMYQALLAFMLLALLSDNTGLVWVSVEAATIAGVLVVGLPGTAEAVEASWKYFIVCGVGIALSLFGTIVLYLAAEPATGPGMAAMSWHTLLPAAARCNGIVLNLAFVFLLLGYGTKAALAPLHNWMPDAHAQGPTPVSAMLSGSMMNVALSVILRLRLLLGANAGAISPGPPIMALGLLSVLFAAFTLWRRNDVKRFFAVSSIEQGGVVAFAFGLGGAVPVFAGLLHLTLHTLVKTAIFGCVGWAAQRKGGQSFFRIGGLGHGTRAIGLLLAAAIVAIAGLPPFGLFVSEFMIMTETMRRLPLLVIPLALGLLVGAWAMFARLQSLCLGPPTPDGGIAPAAGWTVYPALAHLALAAACGLLLPGMMSDWLGAIP
jgi:hydrogenase-4 component F